MPEILADLTALPVATSGARMAVRLVAAIVLGALIGIEREAADKPAGLRTHILVAAGACLFTLLALELTAEAQQLGGDVARADPVRAIEAVTAGIAFLAAGTILRIGGDVSGLTTGAGLWVAGAIGVACGIGQIPLAGLMTLLVVIVLFVVRRVERAAGSKGPCD